HLETVDTLIEQKKYDEAKKLLKVVVIPEVEEGQVENYRIKLLKAKCAKKDLDIDNAMLQYDVNSKQKSDVIQEIQQFYKKANDEIRDFEDLVSEINKIVEDAKSKKISQESINALEQTAEEVSQSFYNAVGMFNLMEETQQIKDTISDNNGINIITEIFELYETS